jgi:hypothetical protein
MSLRPLSTVSAWSARRCRTAVFKVYPSISL